MCFHTHFTVTNKNSPKIGINNEINFWGFAVILDHCVHTLRVFTARPIILNLVLVLRVSVIYAYIAPRMLPQGATEVSRETTCRKQMYKSFYCHPLAMIPPTTCS